MLFLYTGNMGETNEQLYLGVHVTAERKPYAYAVLDRKLRVLTLQQGYLEEVLAYASSESMASIAINAPRKLNCGLMGRAEIRNSFHPSPSDGRWVNLRLVEFELHRQGVRIHRTPARMEDCPEWMQKGFRLYAEIEGLGFRTLLSAEGEARWVFETHAEAGFRNLVGFPVLDGSTTEGCIQRQLILMEEGVQIPDPMEVFEEITRYRMLRGQFPFERIYDLACLNALLAAYTAWQTCNQSGRIKRIGAAEEGEILLPGGKKL